MKPSRVQGIPRLPSALCLSSVLLYYGSSMRSCVMEKQDTVDRKVASFRPTGFFNLPRSPQQYTVLTLHLLYRKSMYVTHVVSQKLVLRTLTADSWGFWLYWDYFILQSSFFTSPLSFRTVMLYPKFIICASKNFSFCCRAI